MLDNLRPWPILLAALSGWVKQHQQRAIENLREENLVRRKQLGKKRLRPDDCAIRTVEDRPPLAAELVSLRGGKEFVLDSASDSNRTTYSAGSWMSIEFLDHTGIGSRSELSANLPRHLNCLRLSAAHRKIKCQRRLPPGRSRRPHTSHSSPAARRRRRRAGSCPGGPAGASRPSG